MRMGRKTGFFEVQSPQGSLHSWAYAGGSKTKTMSDIIRTGNMDFWRQRGYRFNATDDPRLLESTTCGACGGEIASGVHKETGAQYFSVSPAGGGALNLTPHICKGTHFIPEECYEAARDKVRRKRG